MTRTIGIRRENKNEWERRVPLVPEDLVDLQKQHSFDTIVQTSHVRVFTDDEYRNAGITVQENLEPASIVFAVKEIPPILIKPERVYVFFAHVIKGQLYNMPMLHRLMEQRCTLVDYERILDEQGRRMIFFGVHAGFAGMIETLRALGKRLDCEGITTPLVEIGHAYEYEDLEEAKRQIREIGRRLAVDGLPQSIRPLVFGIAGYGNVSRGAQEILDLFTVKEVRPGDLPKAAARRAENGATLIKVVFKEEDMVRPVDPKQSFELQDYYDHPEKYVGIFEEHLPYLDVLVNTTYWDERYPRLVTKEWARKNYTEDRQARLQVIGDISCDIEGGIELTLHATDPGSPCYVYDPMTNSAHPGYQENGPVIMAVDNLPSELSRESSVFFSRVLRDLVGPMVSTDWKADFADLQLPAPIKRAVIVHKGELTPDYRHLKQYLAL